METLRYNIHDRFSFQMKRNRGFLHDVAKDMRMHYHYFLDVQTTGDGAPDMEVNIGPFSPDLTHCYSIDRKYYIRPDFLFYRDMFHGLRYAVQIKNLENGKPSVHFQGNVFGLRSLLAPNIILNDHVVQPLLEICLNQLGMCLLHCAGVVSGEKAYLFAGRGGSRKTTLAMEFVSRGMKLVGDDYILLGKEGFIYSYPTNLPVFEYRVQNLGSEEMTLLDKMKAKGLFKAHLPPHVQGVAKKSKPACLFLIYPKKDGKVQITEATKEEAVLFLLSNNLLEMMHSPFYLGLLAYRLISPHSPVSRHHEKLKQNIQDNLPDIPIFKLMIPTSWDTACMNAISAHIQNAKL